MKRPLRILFIDDEIKIHQAVSALLSDEFVFHSATSGLEGLGKVKIVKPDLILLDLIMPGLDGFGVLRKLREDDNHIPVVVLSGNRSIFGAVEAMKLGAKDYIEKPFQPHTLKARLRKFLPSQEVDPEIEVRAKIIGKSAAMLKAWRQIHQYAPTDLPILLEGPTGTGKELFSRAIHEISPRRANNLVAIDCSTLPESLVEGELFGFEKGAFTGASASKVGRVEWANGGTLFFDEVSNISLNFQAKLLRVIQEMKLTPLGGKQDKYLDIRFVGATNVDIQLAIREGSFREDLFYRLGGMVIKIPPLTEREGDIPLLVQHFLNKFGSRLKKEGIRISPEAMEVLGAHHWPGNVRELAHVIHAAAAVADDIILPEHLVLMQCSRKQLAGEAKTANGKLEISLSVDCDLDQGVNLKEIKERAGIEVERKVLDLIRRKFYFNQTQMAKYLGVDPKTLRQLARGGAN